MIVAPFTSESVDPMLPKLVAMVKDDMAKGEDDALFILTGMTGTGKSSLGMHIYEIADDDPDPSFIAITRKDFAVAHKKVTDNYGKGIKENFLQYDEADVSSRSSLTKWNTSMMRLYWTNRVFQCFHLWCNPSLKYVDKAFIEERVKGVFFVFTKEHNKPRKYYFYTKRSILAMIEKNMVLNHSTLRKHAEKYAMYRGWFRKYEGSLLSAYKQGKIDGATQVSDDFYEEFGQGKTYSLDSSARALRVSVKVIRPIVDRLMKEGKLLFEDIVTPTGRYRIREEHLSIIAPELHSKYNIRTKAIERQYMVPKSPISGFTGGTP